MTKNQTEETREAVAVAIQPAESRLERMIEDPFASIYLAAGTIAVAICFILGGMSIINAILY